MGRGSHLRPEPPCPAHTTMICGKRYRLDPVASRRYPVPNRPCRRPLLSKPAKDCNWPVVAAVIDRSMPLEIDISLNGTQRSDVEDCYISEGWVRLPAGRIRERRGKPLLIKPKRKDEVFCR